MRRRRHEGGLLDYTAADRPALASARGTRTRGRSTPAFPATRPPFLIASATPVAVGTAWAGAAFHRFDGLKFGLALAIMLLAHAARQCLQRCR